MAIGVLGWLRRPQVWAALILALWLAALVPRPIVGFLVGGIQVNEPDHQAWVDRLKAVGMNTVEVTVYAKQGEWNSSNLWWQEDQPWVVQEIDAARASGLEVVLILRVALDHAFPANRFYWHGQIWPESEQQLEQWFDRYQAFVEKWAAIAERHQVSVLAVGSEMNALASTTAIEQIPELQGYWLDPQAVASEQRKLHAFADGIAPGQLILPDGSQASNLKTMLSTTADAQQAWSRVTTFQDHPEPLDQLNKRRRSLDLHWRTLINAARQRFSRTVTYAANFDQFEQVGFWDALDWMGINAYFPLRTSWSDGPLGPSVIAELESGWEKVFVAIETAQRGASVWRQPILFTELGYTQRRGSTFRPWTQDGFDVVASDQGSQLVVWDQQPTDANERALAVRALRNVHRRLRTPLQGVLYWKLSTRRAHRRIEPFVLLIDERSDDPMLEELSALRRKAGWH